MPSEPPVAATTTPSGAREATAILHWQHRRGGGAHCLIRVHRPATPAPSIVVVSEIRSNPEDLGISGDFPAIAAALFGTLPPEVTGDPADIIWIAHHGEFSYYDAWDAPETFTVVEMRWDGQEYQDDPHWHRRLSPSEVAEALREMSLAPIPAALGQLGWSF